MFGNKTVNREGLEVAVKAVWNILHMFTVDMTGVSNSLAFYFGSVEQCQRVLGGGPWCFEK